MSRRPGSSGTLHREGKPSASLFRRALPLSDLARNGETALLIPTRRSGTTRISRRGRPFGPLQVNPLAWLLAGKRPATGSPNRSGGRARGLGSTARGLLSGERLLPRHRGGGSRIVSRSLRHELLENSRLRSGLAELIHYSANRLPK